MPVSRFRLAFGWLKELLLFLAFALHLPFSLIPFQTRNRRSRPETIVILPDVLCNPLLYFRLRRAFRSLNFSVYCTPVFNPFRGLRDHARFLSHRFAEENIERGILIGHGMGALVALALPDTGRRRFLHLISLGTPYHGSRLFLPFAALPSFRDMAAGSEYLLLNRLNALLFPQFNPFSAYYDEWIVPLSLAHFGQGRDLIFDQVGHLNLVLGGENIQTLVDFVAEKHPLPPQVAPGPPAPEKAVETGRKRQRAAPKLVRGKVRKRKTKRRR